MSQVFIETCVLVGLDSAEKLLGSFRDDQGFLDALSKQRTESLIYIRKMLKDLENSANIIYLSKTLSLSPYFLFLIKQDSDRKTGFCLVCDTYQQNLDFHFTVFHKVSKEMTEEYRKQFSSHAEAYFPFKPNFKKNKMKVPIYCTGQLKKVSEKLVARRCKKIKNDEKYLNETKNSVNESKFLDKTSGLGENEVRVEEEIKFSDLIRMNETGKDFMDCDENRPAEKAKVSSLPKASNGGKKAGVSKSAASHDFSVLAGNTLQEAQKNGFSAEGERELSSSCAESKSKAKSAGNDGQSNSKSTLNKTRIPKTIRTAINKAQSPPVKLEHIEHSLKVGKSDDIVEIQDVLELTSNPKKPGRPAKVEWPNPGLEIFICEICEMAVNSTRRQSHMYHHKRNEKVQCPNCSMEVRYRNLKNHNDKFHKQISVPVPNSNEIP